MNDYERVAQIIRWLDDRQEEQPALEDLSRVAGLSGLRLHRLFVKWVGITPKDFLQCLTLRHAREALSEGRSVMEAALESGLSGPGRLHDLCVTLEAATPGEVKSGGEGMRIVYGFGATPFGGALVAESQRGVCHLMFADEGGRDSAVEVLIEEWRNAEFARDDRAAVKLLKTAAHTGVGKRNRVSDSRLAGLAGDSARNAGQLWATCGDHRATLGVESGGHGDRVQLAGVFDPLSSGDSRNGRHRRLPLGQRSQTGADRLGNVRAARDIGATAMKRHSIERATQP